jgi:hypothetical protein
MGAWGTALFSDDTACDVRDSYFDFLGDGMSGHEATLALQNEWADTLHDPEEANVFWLSLSACQWKCGRLEPEVLARALNAIDSGSDLARWGHDTKDHTKRFAVLNKLRAQLLSPQPPETRIKKRFRSTNDWKVGDLVAYRLRSSRLIVLKTIGHYTDRGGTAPVCELMDWCGTDIPSSFKGFGIRKSMNAVPLKQFMIGSTSAREKPDNRLHVLGINEAPTQKQGGYRVLLWRWFDKTLVDEFGLE